MDNALNYLRRFLAEPKILPSLHASDPLMAELPEWWQEVLQAEGDNRIRLTLKAWQRHRALMPTVFDFLVTHLRSVNLLIYKSPVTNTTPVRLLYEMEKDGEPFYHAGGNPLQKPMTPQVRAAWDQLPAEFRQFYDTLHNGWYYVASDSMGPSPTEDFFILSDLEWGILEDIGDPGCDLKDLLAVFSNGMGAYVALSIERRAYGDVLWRKDKAPRLNIDAWGVMDAWTEIGLNN